ncbi:hypothetical protein BD779DRAFT_1681540 [Infundibulicybe gibba]|nr:hypothetical protein BD779DRAFT_1681540 [Infundibulicybe gibba]
MSTEIHTAISNLVIEDGSKEILCEPAYHPGKDSQSEAKGKFYAVLVGRQTGIFRDWDTVEPLVTNVSNCRHKSFATMVDARKYWQNYCRANHAHEPPTAIPPPYAIPQRLNPRFPFPATPNRSTQSSNSLESGPRAINMNQLFYVVRPLDPRLSGAALYSNR